MEELVNGYKAKPISRKQAQKNAAAVEQIKAERAQAAQLRREADINLLDEDRARRLATLRLGLACMAASGVRL